MFIFCSILGLWTDSPTLPISQKLFCMRRAGREWASLLPALACASGPRRNSRELWRPDSMVIPLLLKTGGSFRSSCRNPFGPWLGSAFRTGALRYIRPLIDGSGLYPAGYISGLYPEGYNQLICLRIAGLARRWQHNSPDHPPTMPQRRSTNWSASSARDGSSEPMPDPSYPHVEGSPARNLGFRPRSGARSANGRAA